VPDAVSVAKGIAGGFPMGAILARESLAKHLRPGSHGTTFGGNPLACAAANAVLDVLLAPGFLDQVTVRGHELHAALTDLVHDMPSVFTAVRGEGLMIGLVCAVPNTDMQSACVEEGLLTVAAGENVLRIVPPLTLTASDAAEGVARLRRAAVRCLPQHHLIAAK
jgi:acetylornithine/N-succinyldiaminopimelate aminotransferase